MSLFEMLFAPAAVCDGPLRRPESTCGVGQIEARRLRRFDVQTEGFRGRRHERDREKDCETTSWPPGAAGFQAAGRLSIRPRRRTKAGPEGTPQPGRAEPAFQRALSFHVVKNYPPEWMWYFHLNDVQVQEIHSGVRSVKEMP